MTRKDYEPTDRVWDLAGVLHQQILAGVQELNVN